MIATSSAAFTPEKDSRLEQLLAQYDGAKREAEAADARLKDLTDAIKLELQTAAPEAARVDVRSEVLERPLRLMAVESWHVNATKLKNEAPEIYVRYADKRTVWQLRRIGGAS